MLFSVNIALQRDTVLTLGLAIIVVTGLMGCVPRSENDVVLYCSTDRQFAEPILDAFERREGHPTVARQFDVETSKTLGLATRILEEEKIPRCDVFWSGEILHTIRLQRAGVLESRNWRLPTDWPKAFVASDGTWVALGARARVILVNKKRLPNESDWPRSVAELAASRWKGQCGIAKPLYGTTATHMTTLATLGLEGSFNRDEFEPWLRQVKDSAVVLGGNKQVAVAVSSGELSWGLTDTDDALIELEGGAPVAVVYPDQDPKQAGCLMIPGTVAVVKNGPHRIAAKLLADYLSSAETERRLTLGNAAQFAIWPSNDKSIAKKAADMKTMNVDFEEVAKNWDNTFSLLQKEFP